MAILCTPCQNDVVVLIRVSEYFKMLEDLSSQPSWSWRLNYREWSGVWYYPLTLSIITNFTIKWVVAKQVQHDLDISYASKIFKHSYTSFFYHNLLRNLKPDSALLKHQHWAATEKQFNLHPCCRARIWLAHHPGSSTSAGHDSSWRYGLAHDENTTILSHGKHISNETWACIYWYRYPEMELLQNSLRVIRRLVSWLLPALFPKTCSASLMAEILYTGRSGKRKVGPTTSCRWAKTR